MTCTLYRVQKHPFHGVHAAVKVKLTGIARVGAAAGLSLLGMLQPVVDLFRQVIGIVAAKKIPLRQSNGLLYTSRCVEETGKGKCCALFSVAQLLDSRENSGIIIKNRR